MHIRGRQLLKISSPKKRWSIICKIYSPILFPAIFPKWNLSENFQTGSASGSLEINSPNKLLGHISKIYSPKILPVNIPKLSKMNIPHAHSGPPVSENKLPEQMLEYIFQNIFIKNTSHEYSQVVQNEYSSCTFGVASF